MATRCFYRRNRKFDTSQNGKSYLARYFRYLQIINHQHNFDPFEKKISYKTNRHGIADRFDDPSVKASVGIDVRLADFLHDEIRQMELHIEHSAKLDDPQLLFRLRTQVRPKFTQGKIKYSQQTQAKKIKIFTALPYGLLDLKGHLDVITQFACHW